MQSGQRHIRSCFQGEEKRWVSTRGTLGKRGLRAGRTHRSTPYSGLRWVFYFLFSAERVGEAIVAVNTHYVMIKKH